MSKRRGARYQAAVRADITRQLAAAATPPPPKPEYAGPAAPDLTMYRVKQAAKVAEQERLRALVRAVLAAETNEHKEQPQ